MQHTTIKSPDGLQIAVQEWGNPQGREILFIHGFNQCHLSWSRQFRDPALAEKFRMVTFDLRGHGSSGKPVNRDAYLADKLWGDDVATVIETTGLKGPVVVGWSYGGRVISDYLRNHGTAGVAAINYVGGRMSMRFLSMWVLQGVYATCDDFPALYNPPDTMGDSEKLVFDMVSEDFAREQPDLLIVDRIA
ncbi:MAG: alpha/beta fold hydrolase, partial [Xanthobacteraceae bacterium]